MTLDEALTALEQCKDHFIWGLTDFGSIRSRSPAYPAILFCPWTALVLVKLGHAYQLSASWRAAKLFVTAGDTVRLERAADRSFNVNDHAAIALRVRLLARLGLKEMRRKTP